MAIWEEEKLGTTFLPPNLLHSSKSEQITPKCRWTKHRKASSSTNGAGAGTAYKEEGLSHSGKISCMWNVDDVALDYISIGFEQKVFSGIYSRLPEFFRAAALENVLELKEINSLLTGPGESFFFFFLGSVQSFIFQLSKTIEFLFILDPDVECHLLSFNQLLVVFCHITLTRTVINFHPKSESSAIHLSYFRVDKCR